VGSTASSGKSSHLWQTWNSRSISIPIHGNKSLKTGLLRHFLKVAGLTDDFQPIDDVDQKEDI
jgi:predicted RNA binding protein YcfA (HicA-like mRNA interferase family)